MSTRFSNASLELAPRALSERILWIAFSRLVRRGSLELVTASGGHLVFGDGGNPKVRVRFADRAAQWALLLDPDLQAGELFMNKRLVVERGSIYEFIQLALQDSRGDRSVLPFRTLIRDRK